MTFSFGFVLLTLRRRRSLIRITSSASYKSTMSIFLKFISVAACSVAAYLVVQADDKQTQTYKTVDAQKLKIHISKPADWKPADTRPAVVFFHGGGWVGGKPGQFDAHCEHLTKRGMVCFQVQYRLLSKDQSTGDRTPTKCIHDAKSAMRWVRSRAIEFGIDPNRIASGGGSAGGHLAAFLGTTDGTDDPNGDALPSARANAMLLFNPVYNNGPNESGLKAWGTSRVGDRFKEFSPRSQYFQRRRTFDCVFGNRRQTGSCWNRSRISKQNERAGCSQRIKTLRRSRAWFFQSEQKRCLVPADD